MEEIRNQRSPHFWKVVGQTEVVVLLHSLTEFLALERRNNLPDGFEDLVRWLYIQFEVMLGFFTTYHEETDDIVLMTTLASDIRHLARKSEIMVDHFYKVSYQQPCVKEIEDIGELKGEIEGIVKRIGGLMLGGGGGGGGSGSGTSSRRFEYERTREKAIQELNESLPRTTRGWVVDPDTNLVAESSTEDCDILVDRMINGESSPEQLDVITIQGLHNKGTNTLLKKVYNDASIANHFETRVWVKVPQVEHNLRNLLLSILQNIMMDDITPEEMYDEMEVWELKKEILKQLIGRRYLIVLEWMSEDHIHDTEWNEKKDVFPKNNKGSRVILATNEMFHDFTKFGSSFSLTADSKHLPYSVSRQCHNFVLKLKGQEDYWNVFSKMIFGEKECPEELEHLGRRIIDWCIMGPYIIAVIACILRIGENTVSRWSNIVAQLVECPEKVDWEQALNVCYQEMPQHLRMCFLYLCVFPINSEISVKQLIHMWISEGLIAWGEINTNDPNRQARSSIEDVAEKDYLEALIGLSFIQVTSRRSDGGPKTCRIRQNMWRFCRFLYGNPHFNSPPITESEKFGEWRRRLSILKNCGQFMSEVATNLKDTASESYIKCLVRYLHSFSCFSRDTKTVSEQNWELDNKCLVKYLRSFYSFSQDTKTVPEQHWESFFVLSDLLRVLNLGEEEVGKLPKAIARLFHLRYLRVKPTKNITVPKCIFNIQNLQTIDLRTIRLSELPKEIWRMRQLRHLYLNGDGPSRLPIPESEDGTLPNLQTLSYVSIDNDDDGIHISEKAPNLRKLGLYGYQCFSMSEQEATFNLPYLQKLKFAGECNFEVPITFPDTITKISTGKGTYLQQDVIKMFGKLSNLRILKLMQTTFDDGELVFEEGSFPQLQLLKFESSNVVTWGLKDGAMPNLHYLIISKCPQLIEPPAELWNMKTLQELDLSRASMKFAKKVRNHLKNNEGSKLVVNFTTIF